MKFSMMIFLIMSMVLAVMVLVDAAAVKKKDKDNGGDKKKEDDKKSNKKNDDDIAKHNAFNAEAAARRKKNKDNNPYALSASEERFSSCGDPSKDLFAIESVTSNRHLCSGCKACVDLEGLLKGRIEKGATVRLEVYKYFFKVFDEVHDLCDALENVKDGPRCPIEPTAEGLRACLPLSKSLTTDISASIKVTGFTATKKPLFCIGGTAMVESQCPEEVGPGTYACNN